jgi:hypothetical protein
MDTIDDLDELVETVDGPTDVYVRYSIGPDADDQLPSRDHEAGVELPGLPVAVLRPEPWWPRPSIDWIARRLCQYRHLATCGSDRRPWILTGSIIGYGPDHEPLLADVAPIAWIGPRVIEQANRRYHEHFHVGRDSTPPAAQ